MTDHAEAGGRMLRGSCFCRAVGYVVADEFGYALNCHCASCRRTTGSAFKPFAGIERDKLRIVDGADKIMIFGEESGHNAHCRLCGSLLAGWLVCKSRHTRPARKSAPASTQTLPASQDQIIQAACNSSWSNRTRTEIVL